MNHAADRLRHVLRRRGRRYVKATRHVLRALHFHRAFVAPALELHALTLGCIGAADALPQVAEGFGILPLQAVGTAPQGPQRRRGLCLPGTAAAHGRHGHRREAGVGHACHRPCEDPSQVRPLGVDRSREVLCQLCVILTASDLHPQRSDKGGRLQVLLLLRSHLLGNAPLRGRCGQECNNRGRKQAAATSEATAATPITLH
mmetsp:Transcript_65889/g.140990  ORF Transcript_65889/g.140990 Transcript_65889/m.140990 type:complete len:202 (+) Transcript_65889:160-765(+)